MHEVHRHHAFIPWIHSCVSKTTVNPALFASCFVRQMQLSSLHISLFKVAKIKYFSQGKDQYKKFLFVPLDKIKILTL
jgi:hypothetical protein